MGKIKVYVKEPGKDPFLRRIDNTLGSLQKIVDGCIEVVTIAKNAAVICNEEGLLRGMEFNCLLNKIAYVGPIIIAGVDGEEFADFPLDQEQFKRMFGYLYQEA